MTDVMTMNVEIKKAQIVIPIIYILFIYYLLGILKNILVHNIFYVFKSFR